MRHYILFPLSFIVIYLNNTVMESSLFIILRNYCQHLCWHLLLFDCQETTVRSSGIEDIQCQIIPKIL